VKIYFYCIHCALHTRLLYKRFHSIHHEYKAPCALESVYVHPVEYVLNSFTALVGPTFLATSPHLFTAMVTTCLFTFLQVHNHTGLWLPFVSLQRATQYVSVLTWYCCTIHVHSEIPMELISRPPHCCPFLSR
jgi:methylsterol monooxygenase